MKSKLLVIALLLTSLVTYGQKRRITVFRSTRLPTDTIVKNNLLNSLDNFLKAAQKPNEENTLIFPDEKIETFVQLDEVNGIEKSSTKENFFKPYLTNVVAIEDNNYLVKVSYTGLYDTIPMTSGSFEFIAHKSGDSFLFSSPLKRNTKNWKTITVGTYNTFHYQSTINQATLKEFEKLVTSFDKKLKVTDKKCEFYLCGDFVELQKLVGIDSKYIYNGMASNTLSSSVDNKSLVILGNDNATFNKFDRHDLWHDRLSLVIPRSKVNKPVDEAIAYLYGGSWGIRWADILKTFKEKVASNKNTNWAEMKEVPLNFGSQSEHLMADYVVDALLVKKIEKEKGFNAVWKLLNCGPFEKGNDNFYKTLERLTDITKLNYNEKVAELILQEK